MLIDIALCENLFHTATGTAFADIIVGPHRETWPIRSKRFRSWLRRCYYQATGEAASAAEIRSALVLIVAWLLAALRSGGLYPLLAISGEQGSARPSSPSCSRR